MILLAISLSFLSLFFLILLTYFLYFPSLEKMHSIEPKIENHKDYTNINHNLSESPIPSEILVLHNLHAEFMESVFDKYVEDIRWDILIAIGDIYRKGSYPRFKPCPDIAAELYKLASRCPDPTISGLAQSRYVETYADPIQDIDQAGVHYPASYGESMCNVVTSIINQIPQTIFRRPRSQTYPGTDKIITQKSEAHRGTHPGILETTTEPSKTIQKYKIDYQNVHDHGISQTTKYNVEKHLAHVYKTIENIPDDTHKIINSILEHNGLDAEEKREAYHVIDNLSDSIHSTYGISEKQTLNLIWSTIHNKYSHIKDNLIESLGKQLASAIEKGHVVCSSGKIARIISTLDGIANEISRPIWAIKEELSNKAIKIRNEYTPQSSIKMREEFSKQVREEYIDKLGMNPAIIEPLISEYEIGFD